MEPYHRLIHHFLNGTIDANHFCDEFTMLWIQERDKVHARRQSWPQPYDELLTEALVRGDLSKAEFEARWSQLWGYADKIDLVNTADSIHSACSVFYEEPQEEWQLDLPAFTSEVQRIVREYESAIAPSVRP